jgi:hypothetical protein
MERKHVEANGHRAVIVHEGGTGPDAGVGSVRLLLVRDEDIELLSAGEHGGISGTDG